MSCVMSRYRENSQLYMVNIYGSWRWEQGHRLSFSDERPGVMHKYSATLEAGLTKGQGHSRTHLRRSQSMATGGGNNLGPASPRLTACF